MSDKRVCEWDGRTRDVQLTESGEWLCAGCRAAIARYAILSALNN